jgi:Na+-driven multidrug efflux pump
MGLMLKANLLRPSREVMRRILRIGLPAAADGAVMWSGHFAFLMIVARLAGSDSIEVNHAYAAQIVVVRLEAFTYLPASAWAAACATMIGQALGAGLPGRAKACGHEGAFQCGVLTGLVGIAFELFAVPLCALINKDPEVIMHAAPVLVMAGACQSALALSIVYMGSLRGAGDTVYPLIMTATSLILIRLPFGYLLGIAWGLGLFGAWIAVCGDMLFRMTLALGRYQRGRWLATQV